MRRRLAIKAVDKGCRSSPYRLFLFFFFFFFPRQEGYPPPDSHTISHLRILELPQRKDNPIRKLVSAQNEIIDTSSIDQQKHKQGRAVKKLPFM